MITKLSHEQLSALRRIDSPTISNAIETFKLRPRVAGYVGYDIRCIFPELPPTVGYAVTCSVDSTTEERRGIGFQRLYELLANAPKPAIVVMQDVSTDRLHSCHAGEIMSTQMKRLGAVGILTDGGLRDVREVRALGGFQYFCAGLVVSHGNPVCVNVGGEVTISGSASVRVTCCTETPMVSCISPMSVRTRSLRSLTASGLRRGKPCAESRVLNSPPSPAQRLNIEREFVEMTLAVSLETETNHARAHY